MKALPLVLVFFLSFAAGAGGVAAAPPGDYYKSFDGTRIHYEIDGAGSPVLLLHGFTGTGDSWKEIPLYKELLAAGFKVILIDLRGNGLSDKPTTEAAYKNDAEAKDIMGLMTAIAVKTYAAVGYSRGSIIAARLLVLDKRVSKAALGGMGSAFTDPKWPRRTQFYRVLMGEPDAEYGWVLKRVHDMGLDTHVQALIQLGQPSTSEQELSAVHTPVLVICGDKDEDNGSSKALADLIPGSTYLRVPGDHMGTWHTEAFAASIVSFLKRH
jgi:pimeloyl-ACP methyl ester carboxylesterase